MPAKYVGAPLEQPAASSGRDLLPPSLQQIRGIVGGSKKARKTRKTKKTKKTRKTIKGKKQSAGFLPSIGEPFVAAAGKYIAPIALYGVYKFVNGSKTTKTTKTRKTKTRKARK